MGNALMRDKKITFKNDNLLRTRRYEWIIEKVFLCYWKLENLSDEGSEN